MAQKPEGVMALMGTPLNADLSLNEDSIRNQVKYVLGTEATGFWCDGVFAEDYAIDEDVRMRAHAVFAEANGGKLYIGAGCYGINPFQAIRLVNHAEKVGYDMAWVPPPRKAPDDGIFEFFKLIHDSTTLPLSIYSTDGLGVYMNPILISRIASLERMVCMKDVYDSYSHICGLRNTGVYDKISVFHTTANVLSLSLGAKGILGSLIGIKRACEVYKKFQEGDLLAALKFEAEGKGPAQAAFPMYTQWTFGARMPKSPQGWSKAATTTMIDVDLGPPMLPDLPPTPDDLKSMQAIKAAGNKVPFFPPLA